MRKYFLEILFFKNDDSLDKVLGCMIWINAIVLVLTVVAFSQIFSHIMSCPYVH